VAHLGFFDKIKELNPPVVRDNDAMSIVKCFDEMEDGILVVLECKCVCVCVRVHAGGCGGRWVWGGVVVGGVCARMCMWVYSLSLSLSHNLYVC
jgi:hypothetical protein